MLMKVQFRYRHQDGTWAKWADVAPIQAVAACLMENPVGTVLAIKHPTGSDIFSVRQWRRVT